MQNNDNASVSSEWIKTHRNITEHWLWTAEPFSKAQAWLDLLIHATPSEDTINIKGQLVELSRGQQARSEIELLNTWQWSRNKVRRFLKRLKDENMIETETNHLTSIITICNYSNYTDSDTSGDTSKSTSNDAGQGEVEKHDLTKQSYGKSGSI